MIRTVEEFKKRRSRRLKERFPKENDAVVMYKKRRNIRLDKKNHGNTKLPFGLCEREGIEIGKDWNPEDAWKALENKGYNVEEEYKKLNEENCEDTKILLIENYKLASEELQLKHDRSTIKMDKYMRWNGNEDVKVYSIVLNEKNHSSENKEELEKILNDNGYVDTGKKEFGVAGIYFNEKKKKEYDKWKEHYNRVIDARTNFGKIAREYAKDHYPHVYVRFGRPPTNGKSKNYAEGTYEDGVSVFNAYKIGKDYAIDVGASVFLYKGYASKGKQLYEIVGDKVGSGSDDEPILQNVSIKKKIKPDNYGELKNLVAEQVENGNISETSRKRKKEK